MENNICFDYSHLCLENELSGSQQWRQPLGMTKQQMLTGEFVITSFYQLINLYNCMCGHWIAI
jgi:hypothetical protein